jgi:hypothetical protein
VLPRWKKQQSRRIRDADLPEQRRRAVVVGEVEEGRAGCIFLAHEEKRNLRAKEL